jgi:hypothetical protein
MEPVNLEKEAWAIPANSAKEFEKYPTMQLSKLKD